MMQPHGGGAGVFGGLFVHRLRRVVMTLLLQSVRRADEQAQASAFSNPSREPVEALENQLLDQAGFHHAHFTQAVVVSRAKWLSGQRNAGAVGADLVKRGV